MTTALALAAVTASLRDLLNKGFTELQVSGAVGGTVDVTATPPDRIALDAVGANDRVNVFLYQVTRNAGWWNEGLPRRDANGDRVGAPPLAVDLRYVVTAYGKGDLHGEILLGHAMQLLHESPVLTREAIGRALAPNPLPATFPAALAKSGLADQIEQIKITHDPISTEEISRLWSALNVHYRPSVGYQASVVLIESSRSRRAALPVLERTFAAPPLGRPILLHVEPDGGADAAIVHDGILIVRGSGLAAARMAVLVNGVDLTAAMVSSSDEEIRLDLALAGASPARPRAGVCVIQVVHRAAMGKPPRDHDGVRSNALPFVLRPSLEVDPLEGITSTVVGGVTFRSGTVPLTLEPPAASRQRVTLFLTELDAPAGRPARAHSFDAPAGLGITDGSDEASTVRVAIRRVARGRYLARVGVDGAESVPEVDAATGRFHEPVVTV